MAFRNSAKECGHGASICLWRWQTHTRQCVCVSVCASMYLSVCVCVLTQLCAYSDGDDTKHTCFNIISRIGRTSRRDRIASQYDCPASACFAMKCSRLVYWRGHSERFERNCSCGSHQQTAQVVGMVAALGCAAASVSVLGNARWNVSECAAQ